jgi:hypothetical protein
MLFRKRRRSRWLTWLVTLCPAGCFIEVRDDAGLVLEVRYLWQISRRGLKLCSGQSRSVEESWPRSLALTSGRIGCAYLLRPFSGEARSIMRIAVGEARSFSLSPHLRAP